MPATLHLSHPAVSRQGALEESLNTTRFHRHASGLIPTEQGELLLDATRSMSKRLVVVYRMFAKSLQPAWSTTTVCLRRVTGPATFKIRLMLEERTDLPYAEADLIRMKSQAKRPDLQAPDDITWMRLTLSASHLGGHRDAANIG
jgi:DNA-binding transcriptional LysR family regulator